MSVFHSMEANRSSTAESHYLYRKTKWVKFLNQHQEYIKESFSEKKDVRDRTLKNCQLFESHQILFDFFTTAVAGVKVWVVLSKICFPPYPVPSKRPKKSRACLSEEIPLLHPNANRTQPEVSYGQLQPPLHYRKNSCGKVPPCISSTSFQENISGIQ